ncbi:hypothetical protein Lnau_1507 [Legionella nautarum]|uniref:Uncharacterized protein n=1 Tax=Legionella nautarum TaxID=45070 RepID=A0A0W0WW27_9GAMM|nr:phosphotransferase [Legionella nautarum]KTD36523.1 hypothetical protein Lnau_1507 [Legionella nautarum]
MTIQSVAYNNNPNDKTIQWACNYLTSHGYELKTKVPEMVQDAPWSYVIRFATSEGLIYLKQTPEQLALEAPIIQILHDQFHASVPIVIAHNAELNCFLMKDSGKSLRSILKQNFDEALLCKAIDQFTSLQIEVAEHADVFFDLGVPDWRLHKFPKLYQQLLTQKDVLIADGLSEMELDELEKLSPIVFDLCEKLSSYSIKPTLVQPDFNDNNTLIDNVAQKITIIDLGEISISHPFFSLLNCLYVIKKHHALTDEDVRYLRIKDACLKNYMNFESKKRLLEALEVALLLFPIYGVFAGYRMVFACDQSKFTEPFQRHARPGLLLREFINEHK